MASADHERARDAARWAVTTGRLGAGTLAESLSIISVNRAVTAPMSIGLSSSSGMSS
jgi:hypothetical protein